MSKKKGKRKGMKTVDKGCDFYEYIRDIALKNGFKSFNALKCQAGLNSDQVAKLKQWGIISTGSITKLCLACPALDKQALIDKKAECDAAFFAREEAEEARKTKQYYQDMEEKAKVAKEQAAFNKNYKAWSKNVRDIINSNYEKLKIESVARLMVAEIDVLRNSNDINEINDSLKSLEYGMRWLKEYFTKEDKHEG